MGRPALPVVERGLGAGIQLPPDKYNMPIEDLNLSVRAYNCLRRSGLMTSARCSRRARKSCWRCATSAASPTTSCARSSTRWASCLLDHGDDEHYEAAPLDEDEMPTMPRTLPTREPRPSWNRLPQPTSQRPVSNPLPSAAGSRGRRLRRPQSPRGEGDEDIEDWKRKLLQLTGEGDEGQE